MNQTGDVRKGPGPARTGQNRSEIEDFRVNPFPCHVPGLMLPFSLSLSGVPAGSFENTGTSNSLAIPALAKVSGHLEPAPRLQPELVDFRGLKGPRVSKPVQLGVGGKHPPCWPVWRPIWSADAPKADYSPALAGALVQMPRTLVGAFRCCRIQLASLCGPLRSDVPLGRSEAGSGDGVTVEFPCSATSAPRPTDVGGVDVSSQTWFQEPTRAGAELY